MRFASSDSASSVQRTVCFVGKERRLESARYCVRSRPPSASCGTLAVSEHLLVACVMTW